MDASHFTTLSRRAARAYAYACGHKMGPWIPSYAACECIACGAVLTEGDAEAFVRDSSVMALGSLSAPCPAAHDA